MRLVLDTNILIASLSSKSQYHWIYQKFINKEFEIAVSNDILFEYQEKITDKYGIETFSNLLITLLSASNVILTNVYYNWDLITNDKSDNKFVDCYLSSRSDYLLTEDHHFDILKNIEFPNVNLIRIIDFKKMIEKPNSN